jgi:hypothetical protein
MSLEPLPRRGTREQRAGESGSRQSPQSTGNDARSIWKITAVGEKGLVRRLLFFFLRFLFFVSIKYFFFQFELEY